MTHPNRFILAPIVCALVLGAIAAPSANAGFHVMQIEQIIGGVNGDTTAQAIQLRTRTVGQNFVSGASIKAFNASGGGAVLLKNITTDVTDTGTGMRILLATPNFANYTTGLVADFTMVAIPSSFLAAGRLTFEDDFGTIYWSVSWGGASYTGSNAGNTFNDADGNFGPPVAGALPSTSLTALKFTGAAAALSTTNLANYSTSSPAIFTNSLGNSFTVHGKAGDFNTDGIVDGTDFTNWQRGQSPNNGNAADLGTWRTAFVGSAVPAFGNIPEPASLVLLFSGIALLGIVARQYRWREILRK